MILRFLARELIVGVGVNGKEAENGGNKEFCLGCV